MSSPPSSQEASTPRRRQRSEIESDEDADVARASGRLSPSSSAKRARPNGFRSEAESESPEPEPTGLNGSRSHQSNIYDDDEDDDGNVEPSEFQPGAIVRVKLTNFVTYENVEFFPGPNLNMVIGPNGTGKSSLVCAICLGLGWGPQHLGRANQVGEFVKHNMTDAFVEIELQKRPGESRNHVVRLRIIRDGNSREWWLDGKKTSLKAVQALTRSLSIQIDNLCQFLPQDKVSEFAGLSPVDLLLHTQRAAAPEEMLEWHENLKKLRKEQKNLEIQLDGDKDNLERQENRQQNLQAEVERLQERNQIVERVDMLKKTIPFVEYKVAVKEHREYSDKKKEAQKSLKELKERLAPTMKAITEKNNYQNKTSVVVKERKQAIVAAERKADAQITVVDNLMENIKKLEQEFETGNADLGKKKQDIVKAQRKVADFKARLNDDPVEFNAAEWNERIRAKEHELRDLKAGLGDIRTQNDELMELGRINRQNREATERELAAFDTQEGQRMSKLASASQDVAHAWAWVQDHLHEFEKEVYGPPMISCAVKNPRYTDAIESMMHKNDFFAITAQTKNDLKKLSDQLQGQMGLAEVTLRTSDDSVWKEPRPLSVEEMKPAGMDGWAIDFIDCPTPVLAMLCGGSTKLHRSAISLREINDAQHKMIVEGEKLNQFVAGKSIYNISRRREYGPSAVSTTTKSIKPAVYWTDRPADTSAKREIEAKLATFVSEFEGLKKDIHPLREKMKELGVKGKEIEEEIVDLKKQKGELQIAYGHQKALPDKIRREEESLQAKLDDRQAARDKLKNLSTQHDHAILRKAKAAMDHKEMVSAIWKSHEEFIEAEIRFIEAKSDVAALEERNRGIVQQQKEEEEKVKNAERESERVKDIARKAKAVLMEILDDPANESIADQLRNTPDDFTVEALEMDIRAEEAKLEYVHATNPNAIREFERRQAEIDQLKTKISETENKLERIARHITKIRGRWEPELDKLIAEISDAFSYNFEQIGCAGEVSVHKDDDFDQWAIQIKVKFRENESLQLLDAHRQSGGERSVSTIFYLMSLQSLARAPFRVVDEINQGMDPRNERMVHERMVEIACKEHTSQYFLITPKLLTGLRYDKRMKVLCIASGPHMPENYKRLDLNKIIGIRRAIVAAG